MVAVHRRAMAAVNLPEESLDQAKVQRLLRVLRLAKQAGTRDPLRAAAELAAGVVATQAFTDGNKRTAVLAAATYLDLCAFPLIGDWVAFARLLEPIAMGGGLRAGKTQLTDWLRRHVPPRT